MAINIAVFDETEFASVGYTAGNKANIIHGI